MMPDRKALAYWVATLATLPGPKFNAACLVDDVLNVAAVFSEEDVFQAAMLNTHRALVLLRDGRVFATRLEGGKGVAGWHSYHYQSQRLNHASADMRIVYRLTPDTLTVMGFGHRHKPTNIYHGLAQRMNTYLG